MVASVGQAAGPIPPVPVEDLGPRRSIALMRPSVMGYSSDPELYRSGADELLAVLQDGLTSPIGAEYPLRDAAKAHAALEAGETTGSVVLAV
jgi:NADPH2:quinone reductase